MNKFYRRDIAQVVVPLPSNLETAKRALAQLAQLHTCPDHRIKITYDAPNDAMVLSVPVHWAEEDARNETRMTRCIVDETQQ